MLVDFVRLPNGSRVSANSTSAPSDALALIVTLVAFRALRSVAERIRTRQAVAANTRCADQVMKTGQTSLRLLTSALSRELAGWARRADLRALRASEFARSALSLRERGSAE